MQQVRQAAHDGQPQAQPLVADVYKRQAWDITEDMDLQIFGRVLKVWRSEDL